MQWYEKVAQKYNMGVNHNDIVFMVLNGLELNKEKYGIRYCPCKIQKIPDNICPCKELRENQKCHCGLFIKGDINEFKN